MFEISVTGEFERWYQELDSESAEKVAAELNVLERLGPELDGVRASRLLLWFDGSPLPSGRLRREHGQHHRWLVEQAHARMSQVLRAQHEALRCLETPNFQARFLKLEPLAARRAQELLERVRASVRAATLALALARPGAPHDSEWSERSPLPDEAVQAALLELLSCVGLRLEDVADRSSGLRELTIAELRPPQRLLYAIDAPRRRILAILGEALERAYYGDSVRLAELRWREYCCTLQVASAR
jgi:hypothetical protein